MESYPESKIVSCMKKLLNGENPIKETPYDDPSLLHIVSLCYDPSREDETFGHDFDSDIIMKLLNEANGQVFLQVLTDTNLSMFMLTDEPEKVVKIIKQLSEHKKTYTICANFKAEDIHKKNEEIKKHLKNIEFGMSEHDVNEIYILLTNARCKLRKNPIDMRSKNLDDDGYVKITTEFGSHHSIWYNHISGLPYGTQSHIHIKRPEK